jgi:regulator of RNase E activity RraB
MATNKMPWFRLYSEILDDKKIKRICRTTGTNRATVIGLWVILLAMANDSSDRGALQISEGIPYELSDIAFEAEIPDDQVDTLMKLFEKYDMLHFDNKAGWSILNWDGRQFKSDNVAERVAKHRAKKQAEEVKRYGNVVETESDTESDTDTESEKKYVPKPVSDKESEFIELFFKVTGIQKMISTGTLANWVQQVGEWVDMKVTEAEVRRAFEIAQEKNLTIVRPGGLTGIIRVERAKPNQKKPAKSNLELLEELHANGTL